LHRLYRKISSGISVFISRVKSINASGHKFGMAPLGVGWIIWRTVADLPQELIFNVDYLGGQMSTFALNFSRPAGQIIAQSFCHITTPPRVVSSTISKCEKFQPKFAVGTSQHTLLKNRIKALYISKSLITGEISKRG